MVGLQVVNLSGLFTHHTQRPPKPITYLIISVLSPRLSTLARFLEWIILATLTATLWNCRASFSSKLDILLPPKLITSGWTNSDSAALKLVVAHI